MRAVPPFVVATALLLAGCVGAPPPPRPAPRPVVVRTAPPPVLAVPTGTDWRDWQVTPGDWVYRQDGRGSIALFGAPGADALLTLRCDRDRGMVYLSRAAAPGAAPVTMTVRTTSTARALGFTPTGGTPEYLAAALSPRDPLLDAMGFSRGRFIVEQPGRPPLVVPAWAEVPRVTEDCRR